MSQTELARRMNEEGQSWHQSTVARTEAGRQSLRTAELEALAEILGAPLDRLLWPTAENNELDATDRAIALLRRSRHEVVDAVIRLLAETGAAKRHLASAQASKYERVRQAAAELDAEIADTDLDDAVAEGEWRYEHPEGDEGDDGAEEDAEGEPGVVDQRNP